MKKQKIHGSILGIIGFMLSPLSWWNDIFLNIPLAYFFASFFALFSKQLFLPMFVFGYWLTNILGFILVHHGAKKIVSKKAGEYSKKDLFKDIGFSILYTLIVVVLVKIGWIKSIIN